MNTNKLKVAIIGSGNIGCDILCKVGRSELLECTLFAGRTKNSSGMVFAESKGVAVTSDGIDGLLDQKDHFDLVFDATSSKAHQVHAPLFEQSGHVVINLTPAPMGKLCIPTLNGDQVVGEQNINMVTCGGQASIPIVRAITDANPGVSYVEVVSSISAESAGPATRLNLDHYITTTENAIREFGQCNWAKAILNVNPAKPNVFMKTAVSALVDNPDMEKTRVNINKVVENIKTYVKGYDVLVEPYYEEGRLFTMIKVVGMGDYLDPCAGNLDIITASAVNIAERIAQARSVNSMEGAA